MNGLDELRVDLSEHKEQALFVCVIHLATNRVMSKKHPPSDPVGVLQVLLISFSDDQWGGNPYVAAK